MKAAVLHAFGAIPRFEDFPDPQPGQDEVLVHVTAASLKNIDKAFASGSHYGSDGPFGLGVRDADESAGPGFVHGHFGDEGDAHAGTDHGQEAGKVAAFEDDAGIEAGAIASGDGGIAEAVAVAKKKKWIAAKIGELQRGAPGELVSFRQGGVEALGEERMKVEFVAADRKGEDGKVHGSSAESFKKNRRDLFGDGEMHFGKFAGEAGEARRKPIGCDGGNRADDDGAGFGLQALGELVFGAGEFVEDRTGAREKRFAQVREPDGAAEAIEQAAAEFRFELKDLLGERGLRDVAFFGSPGERTGVGDGGEVAELVEFHWGEEFLLISF